MLKATGVILAGGQSKRMGVDKAFIKVGRHTMVQHIAEELKKVFEEVILCGGCLESGDALGLAVYNDLIQGRGPLGGIYTALCVSLHNKCLVAACDMPFVNSKVASFMIQQSDGYDIAVPRQGMHLQPLFAVYSKDLIKIIEWSLQNKRYKVADLFSQARVKYVDEEVLQAVTDTGKFFFNVNTPSDLRLAQEIANNRGHIKDDG